jgi:hypothetical protein
MASKRSSTTSVPAGKSPNPKRVAAGRLNRAKRKGLSDAGRERLREAARKHQPWRFATGPRTKDGKTKAAQNGRGRQHGPISIRQLRQQLADVRSIVAGMQQARAEVERLL